MNGWEIARLMVGCGADRAEPLPDGGIVLSESFREICAGNQCGRYGRCWACPPSVGEIGELMAELRKFGKGVLYQTVSFLEDSFDIEGMDRAYVIHAAVSQRIRRCLKKAGAADGLLLSAGGCRLCRECAKISGQPCRHPELVIPPMEAYGIDVYRTSAQTTLKYVNGKDTVTFFGVYVWRE